MRGLYPIIALVAVGFGAACGTGRSGSLEPADPAATVRTFLAAVQDSNLTAMADLWGGARGPAVGYMDREELRKRLTVIQIYLDHERYELVQGGGLTVAGGGGRQGVVARLFRAGCISNVPFTLVPWSGRWLVNDIDLSAVGNPARQCPVSPAPPGTR
jgi:hypothetical protein